MKKRVLSLILAAVLALALAAPAWAAEVAGPTLQLDGVTQDCVPELSAGRSYLPVETLTGVLGAEAERTQTGISLRRDGGSVILPVAYEREGEAYLPVRAVASALGFSVGWDREKRAVLLVDVWKLTRAAEEGQTWRLTETAAQVGALSHRVSQYAADLAGTVELSGPGAALLTAIPLTDADTAWTLVSQAAEALAAEEKNISLTLGDTALSITRTEAGDTLAASVPASALAPAGLLRLAGLARVRASVTFMVSDQGADALVTAGTWSAQARWSAC